MRKPLGIGIMVKMPELRISAPPIGMQEYFTVVLAGCVAFAKKPSWSPAVFSKTK